MASPIGYLSVMTLIFSVSTKTDNNRHQYFFNVLAARDRTVYWLEVIYLKS